LLAEHKVQNDASEQGEKDEGEAFHLRAKCNTPKRGCIRSGAGLT
jgi:hypothetical protein